MQFYNDNAYFIEQFFDILFRKFILRAHADGKPEYLEKTIGGTTYKAVKVGEKIYIPNN